MDKLDMRLLQSLMKNGRATWSDLAAEIEMSSPAVADACAAWKTKA
ncbi:hypothetical protein NBRC111894_3158 [Sporolactobacillus inulinus]|uniref:HTH asnC-type domain-containing protein n=1 Tax=Sporolactobacillus inulinus TaxID=2078 RepID=A0A4Y1ZF78_9BACL|nr:AsnC family protein [Sporolactobacillus inulinus]GAY77604.1 hypothetical protein NBRC111894_3158 [Sporolactobacillus inulinus]